MKSKSNLLHQNHPPIYDPSLFFELSHDLLCISGYDGYFKRINPAGVKLLGYTEEELLSRPVDSFVYEEDKEITTATREAVKKRIPVLNFENRYVTKSGDVVWLAWTSIPLEEEELVYAIAKDITYKKKIEAERNLLYTDLTQLNSNLRQLIYKTAHDLRSPVNNMLSLFHLLDDAELDESSRLEILAMLKKSAEDLKVTLDEYTEYLSREERLSPNLEEVSLTDTLEEVLKSIQSLVVESRANIAADFSIVKTVRFNKIYLKSIFLNLITNAIKYAQPDSIPEITISMRKGDCYDQLVFSDKGLGFDMNKVGDRIFGLHQKFHNHIDSKGIGLYLVHNHITSLGGKITVTSTINKGATFCLFFKSE